MAEYHIFNVDNGPKFDIVENIFIEVDCFAAVVDTVLEVFWLPTPIASLVHIGPMF